MSGFANAPGSDFTEEERESIDELANTPKVVFSSTLEAPLLWPNAELVRGDAVEKVAAMKRAGTSMSTIGSLALCRSLLKAGLVDRYRVVVFPVITGSTGSERIYDSCSSTSPRCSAGRLARRSFSKRARHAPSRRSHDIPVHAARSGPRASARLRLPTRGRRFAQRPGLSVHRAALPVLR
jgi:hypothetical protein